MKRKAVSRFIAELCRDVLTIRPMFQMQMVDMAPTLRVLTMRMQPCRWCINTAVVAYGQRAGMRYACENPDHMRWSKEQAYG